MKKFFTWLKDHWYVPVFFLISILSAVVGVLVQQKWNSPTKKLKTELQAIDAGAEAAVKAVEHSTDFAVAELEDQHDKTMENMNEKQKVQAEKLKSNPKKLAKFLVRVGNDIANESGSSK